MPTSGSRTLLQVTPSAPSNATVGTSSALASSNPSRTGFTAVNNSANWIYLAWGTTALVNCGIALGPNGGSFTMGPGTFTTDACYAIASGASSNLSIQEYV